MVKSSVLASVANSSYGRIRYRKKKFTAATYLRSQLRRKERALQLKQQRLQPALAAVDGTATGETTEGAPEAAAAEAPPPVAPEALDLEEQKEAKSREERRLAARRHRLKKKQAALDDAAAATAAKEAADAAAAAAAIAAISASTATARTVADMQGEGGGTSQASGKAAAGKRGSSARTICRRGAEIEALLLSYGPSTEYIRLALQNALNRPSLRAIAHSLNFVTEKQLRLQDVLISSLKESLQLHPAQRGGQVEAEHISRTAVIGMLAGPQLVKQRLIEPAAALLGVSRGAMIKGAAVNAAVHEGTRNTFHSSRSKDKPSTPAANASSAGEQQQQQQAGGSPNPARKRQRVRKTAQQQQQQQQQESGNGDEDEGGQQQQQYQYQELQPHQHSSQQPQQQQQPEPQLYPQQLPSHLYQMLLLGGANQSSSRPGANQLFMPPLHLGPPLLQDPALSMLAMQQQPQQQQYHPQAVAPLPAFLLPQQPHLV